MPANHVYKFEVTVTHTGTMKDFDYFFTERRQNMTSEAKLISHRAVPLSEEENKPKTEEKLIRSFLKRCLEQAGFTLIKSKDLYQPNTPKNSLCLSKESSPSNSMAKHFRLFSRSHGQDLRIPFEGTTLTIKYKTYQVYDGGLRSKNKITPYNFSWKIPVPSPA